VENKEYINQLLHKYLDDQASEEEVRALFTELEGQRDRAGWEELLLPVFEAKKQVNDYNPAQWEEMISNILQHPPAAIAVPAKTIRLFPFPRMVAAAVVLLVIATGVLLWRSGKMTNSSIPVIAKQDIAPVGNRAVLTLADGSTVLLDSSAKGLLAQQAGMQITKSADGELMYKSVIGHQSSVISSSFNTLSTPRGGQYKLTLPDGTQVWLNAATTLRYPVHFAADERRVEMTGEAYFEVAANAKAPFKVISNNQEVKVLGTQFNVNAYTDEESIKTTLLEGAVSVTNPTSLNPQSAILRPGQQAQVNGNQVTVANNVNLEQVVAWKNGQLAMENLDLKAVMRQISRWYDVEVVYDGALPAGRFGGILDQKLYLSNIMEVLEERGVRCRLEGQKLYISAK
jgi:ferric-dicitrate binding protein FerR (iron transport regulator)